MFRHPRALKVFSFKRPGRELANSSRSFPSAFKKNKKLLMLKRANVLSLEMTDLLVTYVNCSKEQTLSSYQEKHHLITRTDG